MTRRRKHRKDAPFEGSGEFVKQPPLGRGAKFALVGGGLLLVACLVSAGISIVQQRIAAKKAQVLIDELGGKVTHYADSSWNFGKIDFAGKPLTDADLTRLGEALHGCDGPREFDLSKTQVTDAGFAAFKGVGRICVLRLDDTRVAGPGLRHLPLGSGSTEDRWEVLVSLARTPTDDAGLENLVHLGELQVLDLTGTKVTGPGLRQLHALKELHTIRLTDCAVDDAALAALDGWTTLYNLNLRGTRITDAGLTRIAGLKQLQSLSLAQTAVTDQGLANLAGLDKLTALTLDDSAITDAARRCCGRCARTAASLDGTRITDAGLKSWRTGTACRT